MSAVATKPDLGRPTAPAPSIPAPDPRRWAALAFIALAQLMVALDATIVAIALPSAQAALHASDAERQWMITAYTLAFGSLLLLGGRVADLLGRKRTFLAGLAGFAAASALGGTASSYAVLLAARALQGGFAAMLAPTALSLLAVTFTEPRERAKAFAVYGAIAGSGAAIGLLLGGVLTEYLSWRWCLSVNVPIAIAAAVGGWRLLPDVASGGRPRFDLVGVVLSGGGLAAMVYACSLVVSEGWTAAGVDTLLLASGCLLGLFLAWEARISSPLLPLRILADRNRGGAYLAVALASAGMFGAFLFLTYYLQVVMRFTPVQAGLGFLPVAAGSQASSWLIVRRLMPHLPARALMAPGALLAGLGLLVLTQLGAGSSYWLLVLPAEVLLGVGTNLVMVPAFSTGTIGVDQREAGIAAATVNMAGQVGASLGTAFLNTVAASATLSSLRANPAAHVQALVHGYSVAAAWGSGILLAGAVVALVMVTAGRSGHQR